MDNSYCLIYIIIRKYIVLCLLQNNSRNIYPVYFISNSSKKIFQLISIYNGFLGLSLNHYLYLGKELYKAELALVLGQYYTQD